MVLLQARRAEVLQAALEQPFAGYSRPVRLMLSPRAERVLASTAVLATMLVAGVLLGYPLEQARVRR